MNDPDDNDNADQTAAELVDRGQEEVLSARPVGRRFRDAVFMLSRDDLERLLEARESDEPTSPPTTIDEFRDVLGAVEESGWQWTTDDPPALSPKESASPFPMVLKELSQKYSRFPTELAAVVKYALWGWKPELAVVGPVEDLDAKAAIASKMLLTEDFRSEFFFEHATRLRRFYDLDWEVMIKAAERNIRRVPGTVYASISLETSETQPDFQERKHTTLFAADARALRRMIDHLGDALKALEDAKSLAHNMRQEGGGDVK